MSETGTATDRAGGSTPVRSVPGRYVTLDGMRGIAALCVMLYHFSEFLTPVSTVLQLSLGSCPIIAIAKSASIWVNQVAISQKI